MLSDLRYRLRALFNRSAMERELDAELRFHLEREVEKLMRAGLPRGDAERRARIALGGVEQVKEADRDARGISFFETLQQDVAYALRGMRARPGFTGAIVATLGLGIGANALMFGIVDRMLYRPPTYLNAPERAHRLFISYMWDAKNRTERIFEYVRYLDFARLTSKFDAIVPYAERQLAIGNGDRSREVIVAATSATTFPLFDAPPALGRYFTVDEDKAPMGTPVAVLGYREWRREYAGSRDVLGKTVQIDRALYTIIGVAAESFVGFSEGQTPAAFIPITAFAGTRRQDYARAYGWSWIELFGVRKPGVTTAEADADLSAAFARSWDTERELGRDRRQPTAQAAQTHAMVAPLQLERGPDGGPNGRVAAWVMGVAGIVLLIACANVANLQLANAVRRRREIAVRLALGVDRGRLLQQLLTESLSLAVLGGLVGLAIAQWGGGAIRALFLPADAAALVISDARTLLFAALITIGVALLTGIAPALHSIREDVGGALKSGTREGTHHRSALRTSLLVFQGALSVVLLVGAGLFVRSLQNVRGMRMGYDADSLVFVDVNARSVRPSPAEAKALIERLRATAAAIPGVRNVTLTVSVPFFSSEGRGAPKVAGRDSLSKLGRFTLQAGSPSYFATTGTRILRGRALGVDDRAGAPAVVVLGDAMAQALWPNEDAIGKRLHFGPDSLPDLTVVGIAEDIHGFRLRGANEFWYYLSSEQYERMFGSIYPQYYVRVAGNPADFVEPIRRAVQKELPGDAYAVARPLTDAIAPQLRSWEFGAKMFVAFGGLAVLLAAIGLYSVVAYAVAQRTHELGVRIALGASVNDILRMVMSQGFAFAGAGVVIGSALSLVAANWIQPLLFSQSARDPKVYALVAAILLATATAATLRPAVRATRVDPTEALRGD